MKTLIINLTRFGDLLQTQPVMTGFVDQGDEVGLVCLENFASAAVLLQGVREVFPLPGARFLAETERSWRDALARFRGYVGQVLGDFSPDTVVNLTPSLSARLLAKSLETPQVLGFGLDGFGFNADTTPWAAFLQFSSVNRGASPFNLVDLLQRTAHLRGVGRLELMPPGEQERQAMQARLRDGMPREASGAVAFQLGASDDWRRWPVAHFARLGELFWERTGRVPVLLGSDAERHLADRFAALASCPSVSLVGKTSLQELAAALVLSDMLVTNDTGTMHLAAGLGVPLAAIFLATAQPWDTGPYREGCLCLEPDLACHPCRFGTACPHGFGCRESVRPESVWAWIEERLASGRWPTLPGRGARAWETVRDEVGFMSLVSLSGDGGTDRAVWIAMQRWFFRRFLDGEEVAIWPAERGRLEPQAASSLTGKLKEAGDLLLVLDRQGGLLAQDPRPALKAKFLAFWQRVEGVLKSDPRLHALGSLWFFESQRMGGDMAGLQALVGRYRQLLGVMLASIS